MAESIQVTEGPNKAISGSFPTGEGTGVAAVVNVDTKKALDKPVLRYKQVFSGESGLGEYLDIGKRFGKNDDWGVRAKSLPAFLPTSIIRMLTANLICLSVINIMKLMMV